jgi:hypothetical protein
MNYQVIEVCPETGDEALMCETRWRHEAVEAAEVFAAQSGWCGVVYRIRMIGKGLN